MAVHAPSAIGVNQPYALSLPVPYTPVQADLQQVAYSYAGVIAGPALTGRISKVLTLFSSPGVFTLFDSPGVLTAGPE